MHVLSRVIKITFIVAVVFTLALFISLPASSAQVNKPESYNNIPNIPFDLRRGMLAGRCPECDRAQERHIGIQQKETHSGP